MQIIIATLCFCIIVLLLLPIELWIKTKKLKQLKSYTEQQSNTKVITDNKTLEKMIKLSKGLNKYVPRPLYTKTLHKIEQNLIYGGVERKIKADDFISIKCLSALVCLIYFTLIYIAKPAPEILFLGILATVISYFIPDNWLYGKVKKRQWEIQKDIPSTLTSLAIITDAGLNLFQAIEEMSSRSTGPLAKELKHTVEDIEIGISQKEAFEKLGERCNVEEINFFISALIQGLEKGNSGITLLLREQAAESWDKRIQKAKELAEKASMKLFMPLLLLVFPAFIIFLMGPMIFSIVELFYG